MVLVFQNLCYAYIYYIHAIHAAMQPSRFNCTDHIENQILPSRHFILSHRVDFAVVYLLPVGFVVAILIIWCYFYGCCRCGRFHYAICLFKCVQMCSVCDACRCLLSTLGFIPFSISAMALQLHPLIAI